MNDDTNAKYKNYYSDVFSKTGLKKSSQTFDFYNRCFYWCLPENKSAKILDFGAGLGNLTSWINSKGYNNVTAIDVSSEQCDMAKKICDIDVLHTPYPIKFLEQHQDYFDVIFLSDVIEHIPKDMMIGYVNSLKNSLIPGGTLILKTDNVSTPTGIYQHHFDFTHEYTFVERSLSQLLSICGFQDIVIKGHTMAWPKRPWHWWKPIVRAIYIAILKIVYEAEQPRGKNNPQIYSVNLIASARKSVE